MSANNNNYNDLQRALYEIADNWDSKVTQELFDYVGALAVQEMKDNAPVDTGYLRDNITLEKTSRTSFTIRCRAPYSEPVDKGHLTRSGTFVEAQPFFSAVVGRLVGGDLVKAMQEKANGYIKGVFSSIKKPTGR